MVDFTSEILFFLFLVAFLAGFLDTLAGGGGLIALPALIMSGIPPLSALGTNKLQGSMGTATATYMMLKKKKVLWSDVKHLALSFYRCSDGDHSNSICKYRTVGFCDTCGPGMYCYVCLE